MTYKKFDITDYLDTQEQIMDYLADVRADGDPAMIARSEQNAQRARQRHHLIDTPSLWDHIKNLISIPKLVVHRNLEYGFIPGRPSTA